MNNGICVKKEIIRNTTSTVFMVLVGIFVYSYSVHYTPPNNNTSDIDIIKLSDKSDAQKVAKYHDIDIYLEIINESHQYMGGYDNGTHLKGTKKDPHVVKDSAPFNIDELKDMWMYDSNGKHYFSTDGTMVKDGLIEINGSKYLFDETGNLLLGNVWCKEKEYYIIDPSGKIETNLWIETPNGARYISEDGSIFKSGMIDHISVDENGNIKDSDLSMSIDYHGYDLRIEAAAYIWKFLKEHGWTDTAIAGVLGNFQQESYMTADKHQTGGSGYGIGQWTGERRWALEAWATEQGRDVRLLQTQLDYLLIEPGEQKFVNAYASTNFENVSDAAVSWARGWERYNEDGSLWRVRIPYARAYYAYFTDNPDMLINAEPPNEELLPLEEVKEEKVVQENQEELAVEESIETTEDNIENNIEEEIGPGINMDENVDDINEEEMIGPGYEVDREKYEVGENTTGQTENTMDVQK